MSAARTAILERVKRAQRTGYLPPVGHHAGPDKVRPTGADVGQALSGPPATSNDTLLRRFLAELTALGVEHFVETSPGEVRARVASIVAGRSVLSWDANRLPYGVGDVLTGAATGASPRDAQAAADIGVTGCDAALAETGSLAVLSGAGQPRAASLLPPIHLAIVERSRLRGTMGEFFAEQAEAIRAAANCTFITGPSRTADIELTLTLGVHGPGQVIVVVGP